MLTKTINRARNAWLEVQWQGDTLDVLCLNRSCYWILADMQEIARAFFASRTLYDEYGIPWKRGILFIGPPGNGKTHAVKALINSMEQPCLYIKALHDVQQVFDRARRTSPCILVIEDLDSQLHPQNRSGFLNELDGFAANIGIVTLATTNHPERLDPGILERPSRFDRKYHFELPDIPERSSYLTLWNASLKPALQLSPDGISEISERTADFSFAYLKELFLSSMMQWIASPGQSTLEQVMMSKVATLREQMVSVSTLDDGETHREQTGPLRRFRGPQ